MNLVVCHVFPISISCADVHYLFSSEAHDAIHRLKAHYALLLSFRPG